MPEEVQDDQARAVVGDDLWDQLLSRALKRLAKIEKKSQEMIQEVQTKEANPWLERTGWSKYLKMLNRMELLESIREPNGDPGTKEEPVEVVEAAIWKVMGKIAEIGQASIINRVGIFMRMEAIRTEQHQTRYQPLQSYQHEEEIKDRVRPWRQVLMFFACTQKEHDWASSKYRFTDAQQQAWDRLIEEASHISDEGKESSRDKGEEEEQGENEEDEGAEEEDDEDIEEEDDEDIEEEDDEDIEEEDDVDVDVEEEDETDQVKLKPLTGIQRACLDFCVELLNHTISRHEYDNALVCALAVLGVKEDGWKGPDQYPPILSSMIKIVRFMVVQKALEIASPDGGEDDESNNDRPCDFEHPAPVRVPVGRESTRIVCNGLPECWMHSWYEEVTVQWNGCWIYAHMV
jgi:hypothetical protein